MTQDNIEFWRGEMSQSIKDLATQLSKHDELHKQMLEKQEQALQKIDSIGDHMSQVDILKQEIEELKGKEIVAIKKELESFKRIYYIGFGIITAVMFFWSILKEEVLKFIFGK